MWSAATSAHELLALEPIFHREASKASRSVLEAIVEPEFFEVGASGEVYTRDFILEVVARRYADGTDPDDDAWHITEFKAQALANRTMLVTYRLNFRGRETRRSTIWRHHPSGWKAVYHQGTPTAGGGGEVAEPNTD